MRILLLITASLLFLAGCATTDREILDSSGKAIGPKYREPKLVESFEPVYPTELRKQGISCLATVEFLIDTHGNVIQAKVLQATQKGFEQACIDCVMKWKFTPASKDGRPMMVRTRTQISFKVLR